MAILQNDVMKTKFMQEAIAMASEGSQNLQGGPFGAVVVKDGQIIGRGNNRVVIGNDPTAHAEVTAIRDACQHLGSFKLDGCEIYTSCEPCPMCLGAIYWSRIEKIYYGANREDAAVIGFDDNFFYEELAKQIEDRRVKMVPMMRDEALVAFNDWHSMQDKIVY